MNKNYQLFVDFLEPVLKTWGGENEKERALLGIFEETGELIGKFKKQLRGDKVSDLDIKKEIGDLLYYLRIFAELEKIEIVDHNVNYSKFSKDFFLKRFSLDYFYLFTDDKKTPFNSILSLTFELISLLKYDLSEILEINQKKLSDRKKRNVIKGNGDNR